MDNQSEQQDLIAEGQPYGIDPTEYATEEDFHEDLFLAEELWETAPKYGMDPEEYENFDALADEFLPWEEMWNHLASIYQTDPKEYEDFDAFLSHFYERAGRSIGVIVEYMGLEESAADSEDVFKAACCVMTTEQAVELNQRKIETTVEQHLREQGVPYGLDPDDYDYFRFYVSDLAQEIIYWRELGEWYGMDPDQWTSVAQYREEVERKQSRWEALGQQYGVDIKDYPDFDSFHEAYRKKVREEMEKLAADAGIRLDGSLSDEEYAARWQEEMCRIGRL